MIKSLLVAAALAVPAQLASDPYFKTTDQFGVIGVDIDTDFRLTAICTVSNGEIDALAAYADWLPSIGDALAKAMEISALDKGVSVCGLRHSKGSGASLVPARTSGFAVDIRTYKAGSQIGSDSPSQACKEAFVNLTSMCYKYVKLKENEGDQLADGVTACIDVHATDTTKSTSVVLGAGAIAQHIKDDMANGSAVLADIPCAARRY